MALVQATRFLQLDTPLGDDALLLTGFRGQEEISRLFRFDLDLISDNPSIDHKKLIGQNVTFSVARQGQDRRYFNGIVSRFSAGPVDDRKRRGYRAEVVPQLWLLQRNSDIRIFQQMSVPDILAQVLQTVQVEWHVSGHHPVREYCVQYRETDFNFVSRLMEEEGIYYFFRHENGVHTLVLCDQAANYDTCEESEVDFPRSSGKFALVDHLLSWEHRYELRTGKWAQTDYNFETPFVPLMTNSQSTIPLDVSKKLEFYDYPGLYPTVKDGTPLTDTRMQDEEVDYSVVQASSSCRTFTPGARFSIGVHRAPDEEGKSYVITTIQHIASEPLGYETGAMVGEDYSNSFTCIPDSVLFCPPRLTPKPVVQGLQTAVVVGPKGEEIYCDKYGRVKVQFYWDRIGKKDENSSVWIRTAHNIAGKKWGFQAVPRIGQEVVVDFLEGDPDRPLIVGSVYNADQMPHYALPELNSRTYIKTNSTKGGDGFNELMFEDKKDEERLFLHAEKDMDVRVKNDSKERIYGNRHQIIGWEKDGKKGGDQKEKIYQDKHLHVMRNETTKIDGNVNHTVGYGAAEDGGTVIARVEKDVSCDIGGSLMVKIEADHYESCSALHELSVGGDMNEVIKGNINSSADGDVTVSANGKIILDGIGELSIKGPGGFITIGPSGIVIEGTTVKINCGGSPPQASGFPMKSPEQPACPEPADPAQAWNSTTGMKSAP